MSQAIIDAMLAHEPQAFSNAKKWMTRCRHDTPQVWAAYSKLMATYIDELSHYALDGTANDHAWPIVRYYILALEKLRDNPWDPTSFLLLHNTTELWHTFPQSLWLAMKHQQWNPTLLYQWSLDNEDRQQTTLNTRTPGQYHAEPLHVRMGAGILDLCAKGYPILLDASVHWSLWGVFHGEEVYRAHQERSALPKRIAALAQATPSSFEHAITEFYQMAPSMWTPTSCAHILSMDMSQGHSLTTCSGVLLLYARLRSKHRSALASIQARYPLLLPGFELHLALYPDINEALLHVPALTGHWRNSVHGENDCEVLSLPDNLEVLP